MKSAYVIAFFVFAACCLRAAEPNDEVKSATKKLSDARNYSWKTTVNAGGTGARNARWRPGPTEGQTVKDGVTHVLMTRGESTIEAYLKGPRKGAVKSNDGWKSLAEVTDVNTDQPSPALFIARMLEGYRTPAVEAEELLSHVKKLKASTGGYSAELGEEAVRQMISRGPQGGGGPTVSDARGAVTFWLKDGLLSKYEYKLQGKVTFNANDVQIDRTTTVEIKDVGSTKVDVPKEAAKKMS